METSANVIFHEFCLVTCWIPIEIFYCNQIKTGIEIFSNKNCQVTFGFEYRKFNHTVECGRDLFVCLFVYQE